jgi:DNA-binding beta-propeller fold protein YncE
MMRLQRDVALLVVLGFGLMATPRLQFASGSGAYQVVHGWPQLPAGYAFGQVSGVGVDSHNHVFVFHRGGPPVFCFDGATGRVIASWGSGLFATPHGLAIDSHDNVWLTDIGHNQVFEFSHDGKLLMTLGVKDTPGIDGEHFNQPTDVAVAPSGEFYVSDGYGNSRVAKFSAEGKFLFDWGRKGGKPGEFDLPHGICLDAQGHVYVADRSNSRLQIFDGNGKFIAEWKGPAIGRPWDVFVGADELVYIMDGGDMKPAPPDRGRVIILNRDGKVLDEFGSFGSYDGQFYWGHAVAVAPNGHVYAADVNVGMRVQKFVRKPEK